MDLFVIVITVNLKPASNCDLFVIVITVNLKPACNYGLVCNYDYCKPQTCQ